MSLLTQIEAMKRIVSRARALRMLTSVDKKSVPSLPPTLPAAQESIVTLLPDPQPISADLIALGLRPAAAEKISSAYRRSALALKSRSEQRYAAATVQLRALSTHFTQWSGNKSFATAVTHSYVKALDGWRSAILAKVTQRICELRDSQLSPPTGKKPFNTSAISKLERFFDHNPRPSRAEKHQLATETDMDYKQISVWFQNRRNRSKNGSRVSTPEADNGPDNLPSDLAAALARILDHYDICGSVTYMQQDDNSELATSFAPFHIDRPEHAFPVSYPPLCSDEPFPLSGETRRLLTPWYRTPAQSPTSRTASDVLDLLVPLKQLSLDPEDLQSHCRVRPALDAVHLGVASAYASDSSPSHYSMRRSVSCCQTCTSESCAAHEATEPSIPSRMHLFRQAGERIAGVADSGHNGRRRRGTDSIWCSDIPPPSDVASPTHTLSAETSSAALRGQPYPKGRPSRRKSVAHAVPPRHDANALASSAPAAISLAGRNSKLDTRLPSPPTSLPALSRESSVSSLRSVSSTSSSSSDSDLLLTPPLFPTSVLDYPVPELLMHGVSECVNKGAYKGRGLPDASHGAAYLGYSLACGDRDPTLEIPSSLYSQLEPQTPFYLEPPLIPTLSHLVVAV